MSRTKVKQFLHIGGPHDGFHSIVDAADDGAPLGEYRRVAIVEPFTIADLHAQETTRTVNYAEYKAEQLRDQQGRIYWVFVAVGVNLMAALIDGYRRAP
jgi:hypothetical protein